MTTNPQRDRLAELLTEMEAERGPIPDEAMAPQAIRVVSRDRSRWADPNDKSPLTPESIERSDDASAVTLSLSTCSPLIRASTFSG